MKTSEDNDLKAECFKAHIIRFRLLLESVYRGISSGPTRSGLLSCVDLSEQRTEGTLDLLFLRLRTLAFEFVDLNF